MTEGRTELRATGRRITGLVAVSALTLGLTIGLTSAAWVDQVGFATEAVGSTFDIQGRFASDQAWQDVGLPGDPDTFNPGFEIAIPPIIDALPAHSYVGDVFLCNAGDVDGRITQATLDEVTTDRVGAPLPGGLRLVTPGSIEVENIDVGTVIPANSCEPSSVADPPNDVEGIIHFTTVADFTGQYGSTSEIVIRIWVTSEP
jgi:hypothetical protein